MSKEEVEKYLESLINKIDLSNYNVIFEDEDEKDTATMLKLEIKSETERIEYVKKLTYREYCEGPKHDTKHGGYYWVFGKNIKNELIYIKINKGFKNKPVIIISFHIKEHKMDFPLK